MTHSAQRLATNRISLSWGRWLLIVAAVFLLSACRGLDSQVASNIEQPPAIASDTLATPVAALQQNLATASLSDHSPAASNPSATRGITSWTRPESAGDVAAVQFTTPAPPVEPTPSSANRDAASPDSNTPQSASVIPNSVVPGAVVPLGAGADGAPRPFAQSMVQVTPGHAQPCPPAYSQPGIAAPQPCGPQGCGTQGCGPDPWCPDGIPCGGWRPPGLPCPWPKDEYLCDGGDKIPSVRVRKDWSVDGLELEDTVVHYDTLEGDTHVEPSNRVCLYAPRFASVRKVYGIIEHDHLDRIAQVDQPVPVEGMGDVQIATTSVQPVQPILNLGTTIPSGFRDPLPPIGLENREGLVGLQGNVLPYEDITDLQRELLTNTEKARLTELIQAAMVWNHDTAVQVIIDNIATHEDVGSTGPETVYTYSLEGKPRLRVCKLASRKEALPGETVEFTLQFENVGDQTIGNVTVIDNLTTRLEYVEGSQTSSLKATFSSANNQGDSLTLRWEITEPMKVGEGGVIRFKCRVR